MSDTDRVVRDQIARALASLTLDRNDGAARSKVKLTLETVVSGSVVSVDPIDPSHPTLLRGALNHPDLTHTFHFHVAVPPAALCLVCGEALDHVKQYGCVAGIPNCVYETLR